LAEVDPSGSPHEARYFTVYTNIFVVTHTHTHPFNGPLSRTTWVSWYQKGKTSLDYTEARDIELQWHQLGKSDLHLAPDR